MKIYFYNNFHNGDLHVSRSLVKHIVSSLYQENYIYFHNNSEKILHDIESVSSVILPPAHQNKKDQRGFHGQNTIFLNTWYRAHDSEFFNKYGVTIQCLYHIFKKSLKNSVNRDLDLDIVSCLPVIDYKVFEIDKITLFVKNDKRKKVLICNNKVMSGQCENFTFKNIVGKLSKEFQDVLFIVTNKVKDEKYDNENVKYFDDLFKVTDCDLNEISYLSLFCDVIVGRLSGPQSFSYVKENLLNPEKTFISITDGNKMYRDTSFGVTDLVPKNERAKFIHYTGIDENEIVKVIGREL